MLNFRLFGFPVYVQPWFFLVMAMFGGAFNASTSNQWINVALFVGAGFISILGHELGHALLSRRYGGEPQILLYGMGGLCITPNPRFTREQYSYVVGAGPVASLLMAIAARFTLPYVNEETLVWQFLDTMVYINVFWTILNMLPVIPLDGGQLLDTFLGPRRLTATRMIGGVTASLVAALAVYAGALFGGILFAAYAYENFSGRRIIG